MPFDSFDLRPHGPTQGDAAPIIDGEAKSSPGNRPGRGGGLHGITSGARQKSGQRETDSSIHAVTRGYGFNIETYRDSASVTSLAASYWPSFRISCARARLTGMRDPSASSASRLPLASRLKAFTWSRFTIWPRWTREKRLGSSRVSRV